MDITYKRRRMRLVTHWYPSSNNGEDERSPGPSETEASHLYTRRTLLLRLVRDLIAIEELKLGGLKLGGKVLMPVLAEVICLIITRDHRSWLI